MKRINILRNGVVSNSALFPTEAQALAWLASESANGSFGRVERVVVDSPLQPVSDEDKARALEVIESVGALGEPLVSYRLPADFTHEIVDAASEVESLQALKFLQETDFKVLRHVGQKALGVQTSMSEEQYLALEQQRQAARAKIL